jgi:hypothetical protein
MSITMHAASVPVFTRFLNGLDAILSKAEAHASEKKIDPSVLLQARLYPDMFPLVRQVQIAADFAKSVSARLAGVDIPSYEDSEKTFEELHARIARTLSFIQGLDAASIDGSEAREILLQPGTPRERRMVGQDYLLHYGLPQFFFHVTTTYAILRHNGIEIGKRDYMAA